MPGMQAIVHSMAVTTNQSMLKSQDSETQPKYEWKQDTVNQGKLQLLY